MKTIRVGIVGKRGGSTVRGLRSVPGVEVTAFCERDPQALQQQLAEHEVSRGFERYEDLLNEVDAVCIGSPMHYHVPQAVMALRAGKHVLSEVTAAISLDECWDLVDAARASSATYMLAENYCYFEENILVREMVRRGMFGDIYFGEGEYIHDVRALHHHADGSPTWRYYWQVGVPGNTYITHELGPVMQWFRAQDPGDRIVSVTCLGTGRRTDPEHPHDDTNLTLVQLRSGKLLKMRVDMMSNTPGMTFYSLQGTHGTYESGRGGGIKSRIYLSEPKPPVWPDAHRAWESMDGYYDLMPAGWQPHLAAARASGHGGGDYHTARLFAEAIRDGSPPDIDVYDAVEWTAAGLCSQLSIAHGGVPIRVPDFRDPASRPITRDLPARGV